MYVYGIHASLAALKNPKRVIESIFLAQPTLLDFGEIADFFKCEQQNDKAKGAALSRVKIIPKEQLLTMLPRDAVHQGIALKVQPLETLDIYDVCDNLEPNQIIVLLDQVSDPHNVGSILRSCAVFGAKALIMTDRNSPKESAALAKTACGALEIVPLCVVKNLAQTIKILKQAGFWCIAFAQTAHQTLQEIDLKGKIALIMGSEGDGLRRLTTENCDFYVRLESASSFSTLNVSNASAIALYETFQQQRYTTT